MRIRTALDYKVKTAESKYWEDRWENYLFRVAEIIKKHNFERILEIGANCFPIVEGSDTLDCTRRYEGRIVYIPTYLHDATVKPFPIKDKFYDLVVATQVWEHLEGKQETAFQEVIRIFHSAILSFPYEWDMDNDHGHIGKDIVDKWTLYYKPIEEYREGQDGHKFLIRFFIFNE